MQKRSFNEPDETRNFSNGKVELVKVSGTTLALTTFEPGWKWSVNVKPLVKTESCQASHTIYQISGKLHVKMDVGTENDYGPGDIAIIPPGHDAWTVGDEPAVGLDITAYA